MQLPNLKESPAASELQSATISWLRFPLILGILFIHNDITLNGAIDCPEWTKRIICLFSDVFPRVCVPLFFIQSGFLFFQNFDNSAKTYISKLSRRIHTLLFPYLLWNGIAFLLLILLRKFSLSSPTETDIIQHPINTFFSIFWNFKGGMPANFPMWFIRDLIILVLLTPLIYFSIRLTRGFILIPLFICWLTGNYYTDGYPRSSSLFFFMAGSFLSIRRINLLHPSAVIGGVSIILYLLFAGADLFTKGHFLNPYIHNTGIIFGILTILYIVPQLIRHHKGSLMFRLKKASFFIFGMHALIIYRLITLFHRNITIPSYLLLVLYFLTPLLTLFICLICRHVIKYASPTLVQTLEGSRSKG